MLASDPINTSILFGLAKEYEKAGADPEMIETKPLVTSSDLIRVIRAWVLVFFS